MARESFDDDDLHMEDDLEYEVHELECDQERGEGCSLLRETPWSN